MRQQNYIHRNSFFATQRQTKEKEDNKSKIFSMQQNHSARELTSIKIVANLVCGTICVPIIRFIYAGYRIPFTEKLDSVHSLN